MNKTVVSIGEQIQFTFTGTEGNPPAEFLWNFGDGTNSTAKNPIHTYNSIGNFTVSLILTDYDGDQDQVIKTELITVTATEPEPDIPENPVIPSYPLSTLGIVSLLCFLGLLLRYRYLRKKKFDVLDP